jgi:enterochelin esterase-like enzyme
MNNQVIPPGKAVAARLPLIVILCFLAGCAEVTPTSQRADPTDHGTTATVTNTPSRAPAETATRAATSTITAASSSPTTEEIVPSTYTPAPVVTPTPKPLPTEEPNSCQESGRVLVGTFPSALGADQHRYRIYIPPCYGEDERTYPTLYLFHGGAHSDDHWDYLGIDETADSLISSEEIPPLLIVMPDDGELANNTSGGPRSFESLVINDLLPYVESKFCSWPDREGRAMGGISRGGYWALEIAFRNADVIGSVGGHSASMLDTDAGPDLHPKYTATAKDLDNLRIYLDMGEDDYLLYETQQLHEILDDAGVEHNWILREGQHNDDYWSANLEEYLQWYSQEWPEDRSLYPLCTLDFEDPLE